MDTAGAQVWGPGEGRALVPAAGVEISLKSVAEDTAGGWTIFEYTAPPNFAGPPPHFHTRRPTRRFSSSTAASGSSWTARPGT